MKFNYEKLVKNINEKMFSDMLKQQSKLGLRYFSAVIGISTSTLSRCLNAKPLNIDTLLLILAWLDKDFNEFIIK